MSWFPQCTVVRYYPWRQIQQASNFSVTWKMWARAAISKDSVDPSKLQGNSELLINQHSGLWTFRNLQKHWPQRSIRGGQHDMHTHATRTAWIWFFKVGLPRVLFKFLLQVFFSWVTNLQANWQAKEIPGLSCTLIWKRSVGKVVLAVCTSGIYHPEGPSPCQG